MHKPLSRLVALAVLLAGAVLAQDITGTWQGTHNDSASEQRTTDGD